MTTNPTIDNLDVRQAANALVRQIRDHAVEQLVTRCEAEVLKGLEERIAQRVAEVRVSPNAIAAEVDPGEVAEVLALEMDMRSVAAKVDLAALASELDLAELLRAALGNVDWQAEIDLKSLAALVDVEEVAACMSDGAAGTVGRALSHVDDDVTVLRERVGQLQREVADVRAFVHGEHLKKRGPLRWINRKVRALFG